MTGRGAQTPRWLRDLERFLPLKSQFVLSGNVRDLQAVDYHGSVIPAHLVMVLDETLRRMSYEAVLLYDPIKGFQSPAAVPEHRDADLAFMGQVGLRVSNGVAPGGLTLLQTTLNRFVSQNGTRGALLLDFASRLCVRYDHLSDDEHNLFTEALVLSHRATPRPGPEGHAFFNTLIWIVDKETDLPDWLLIENPMIRHIPVAKPDHHARRAIAPTLLETMPNATDLDVNGQREALNRLVEETEGLLLQDLIAITQLTQSENVPARNIGEAVRRYKVGVSEDPWAKIDRDKIRNGENFIRRRVKGQDHAVTHILDIVKRAVTGVGASKRSGRPRGVVFLAGPTGVGKTELAKTITELLFGDETAYIRFDMSEFSAEHADQRLIGAPPGYVGYDAGGELTNAIREKPFSVVLFDEIEKAHPRILDKFLQILDDGVLTSGRGERVYFSEAFIVFTSNLGIYRADPMGGERVPNVSCTDGYDVVQTKVLDEIDRYFKLVLNRPEILNRIGENVIVFDFIRAEVAWQIFDAMLRSVINGVEESGISVSMTLEACAALKTLCTKDLSNGGRGIRNHMEAMFMNPLARALFDADAKPGWCFAVTAVTPVPMPKVTLQRIEEPRQATARDE